MLTQQSEIAEEKSFERSDGGNGNDGVLLLIILIKIIVN